ncbi:MAG TPA: hypothetical protein VF590_25285 [Isosphaeraceae bacterium]|jgi:hypothetical protein
MSTDDDLPGRFSEGDRLDGLDSDDKPIERDCSRCGGPYNLSLALAAAIAPGSTFDICPGCLEELRRRGRALLEGEGPIYG